MKTVAIIGAGRAGSAIGFLLKRNGYAVTAVTSRTLSSAEQAQLFIGSGVATTDVVKASSTADIVVITTPDGAIRSVCDTIAHGNGFKPGSLVVHTSGGYSLDLLDAARQAGAYRAVIHPLQSVPNRELGVRNIPGSYFRIEADPEAREAAAALVQALGGRELRMPKWSPDKSSPALYHAGAVAVSNYFVALIDYGLTFYETLGADKQEALKAVLPLIRATLRNIESVGIPAALTGPIARGDVETVRDHIVAMQERAPELLSLYRGLARQTIAVAKRQGLPEAQIEELLRLLDSIE
jgi:predicted short-subunit dehydrogenase-like oxidoreductase (DUF2520 family)